MIKKYTIEKPMTIRDAAILLYGSWQYVFKLANKNSLPIDESLPLGTIIEFDDNFGDKRVKRKISELGVNIGNEGFLKTSKLGYLYNFDAASHPDLPPEGWRLPTVNDFNTLLTTVSNSANRLKSKGTKYWKDGNLGTDDYGFDLRGAGAKGNSGVFFLINEISYLYADNGASGAQTYEFEYNTDAITTAANTGKSGFSVRLIKEDSIDPGYIKDFEGNRYKTAKIGSQVWTAQNWASKYFNEGTEIPTVTGSWTALLSWAKCAYGDDEDNVFLNKKL